MPFISERDRKVLRQRFAESLQDSVKVLVFTQRKSKLVLPGNLGRSCEYCEETRQLVEELAELSDKIAVEVYEFNPSSPEAQGYGVDKVPALVLLDDQGRDYGIRFFGIPAGYEFTTLVEDIQDLSRHRTHLAPRTRERLQAVKRPVHLQVFVTPTCPYCPRAVRLAHQMAMESPFLRADAVEAMEFPDLAQRYRVYGVPKVVLNEQWEFEGALPEDMFLLYVLKAADALEEGEREAFAQMRRLQG